MSGACATLDISGITTVDTSSVATSAMPGIYAANKSHSTTLVHSKDTANHLNNPFPNPANRSSPNGLGL